MTRLTIFLAVALWFSATQADAQFPCPAGGVSVIADPDPDAALELCDLTARAIDELAACSVPLQRTIQIEIVDTLPDGCVGQYYCGEDRIELLSRDAAQRILDPDGAFSSIDPDAYFYSILVHELTHAALDGMPCPVSDCIASQEYVAYAMQMRSYSPEARAAVLTRPDFDRPIAAEEINPFIVLMAPEVFIQKVWRHFSQQDDPCSFIGEVVSGAFLFDHEMF